MRSERGNPTERVTIYLCGLLLAVAGLAAAPAPAAPGTAGFEAAALAELEAELGRIVGASEVPGAAVALVTRDGEPWARGFGQADLSTGRRVTPETLFRTNSVSKSLVALAVLRLVEEERVALEDRLREVAPEIAFENRWEDTHPVRVVHLLEHTTGFDDLHLREYRFGPEDGTLREALAVNPAPRDARWPPGTRMAYDNGAYAVAAYLVEKLSGERFEAYVERKVLRPLGMTSSGFGLDRVDRERLTLSPLLGGPSRPLLPAGGDLFRTDDRSEPAIVFLRDRGGEVTGLRTWDPENLRAGNYERTSAPGAYLPLATLLLSLLLAASALLVAPVRGVAALVRRFGGQAPAGLPRRVHALPLLAVLSLVAAAGALLAGASGDEGLLALGRPSVPAVAYWLLSWTFALLSAAALFVTARALHRPPRGLLARLALGHSFLVALACAALAIQLAGWGWLGLRTWAY